MKFHCHSLSFSIQSDPKTQKNYEGAPPSTLPTIISTTVRQQSINSPTKSSNLFERVMSRLPSLSLSPVPETAPINNRHFFRKYVDAVVSTRKNSIACFQKQFRYTSYVTA
jgi:hypothetical protein